MMKRTVLGVLMLALGLVTATTLEGLLIALPLLALGLYTFVPALAGERAFAPPRFSAR
jgi:hypothetical protein